MRSADGGPPVAPPAAPPAPPPAERRLRAGCSAAPGTGRPEGRPPCLPSAPSPPSRRRPAPGPGSGIPPGREKRTAPTIARAPPPAAAAPPDSTSRRLQIKRNEAGQHEYCLQAGQAGQRLHRHLLEQLLGRALNRRNLPYNQPRWIVPADRGGDHRVPLLDHGPLGDALDGELAAVAARHPPPRARLLHHRRDRAVGVGGGGDPGVVVEDGAG